MTRTWCRPRPGPGGSAGRVGRSACTACPSDAAQTGDEPGFDMLLGATEDPGAVAAEAVGLALQLTVTLYGPDQPD